MTMRALAILALLLGSAGAAHSQNITPEEARKFFDRYVQLSDAYDTGLADLYSDSARITSLRRYPIANQNRTIKISGAQWRTMIRTSMPAARAKGDRSEFKNLRIEPVGDLIRVRADRYAVVKCYWD